MHLCDFFKISQSIILSTVLHGKLKWVPLKSCIKLIDDRKK